MKQLLNRVALALMAMMLVISSASAAIIKDEVVYALLMPEGSVKSLYVVNAFEADEKARGEDFGAYRETQALTPSEDFSYEGDRARFAMEPGRFYYQGIPADRPLPWEIAIRYTLDGKALRAEDLSGATGRLGIAFSVRPLAEGKAFSQNLAMTVTLTLEGKRSLNVQADKATMAYAGGNITLSYVILPGQEASYQVQADVKDFAMAGIQFAAIRMGVDKGMYQNIATQALEGSPFAAAASAMMEQFLTNMGGKPTPSFMDERNTIRGLQFVMVTETIPERVEEPLPTQKPAEGASSDIWRRILGLFGN